MPLNLAKRWEYCGIGGADPLVLGSAPQSVQMFGSGKNKCHWPILAAPLACTLFHIAVGLGEFRILDCHVVFGFLDLNREAAVGPRKRPAERTLHAVHL